MWDVRYNMIRRLLLVVGIIVSLSSCGGDIAYRIEGKLTNLEDQTLYAVFENEDIKVVDTVTCGKPGEFLIEKKQGDFREVTIFFGYGLSGKGREGDDHRGRCLSCHVACQRRADQ